MDSGSSLIMTMEQPRNACGAVASLAAALLSEVDWKHADMSLAAHSNIISNFPIRASVVSYSVSLAGLETTLLCLELCPMGWK